MNLKKNGSVEEVKTLIENKTDMDVICLCWASLHGNIEVVKFLISISANIHAKDRFGTTPLITASESRYIEIVKILIGEGGAWK